MRSSSIERYRAFVRLLLCSALLLVIATLCDLRQWCPDCSSVIQSQLSKDHSLLNLSVEGDDKGLLGKCVAVRVKGHKETLTLEQAKALKPNPSLPLKVGLIFLDRPDGFISSGKVVNRTGVFHLYHYLEFLLVSYHQLKELQAQYTDNTGQISLSSPDSLIQVPWIYVPLLQSPQEVCGVANGMNCKISSLLFQSPTWYGMESNPSWLQTVHPAYHGQHSKRQWDEQTFPLDQSKNYPHMQETADMAFVLSLRHHDRCNHEGRNMHGWNEFVEDFPMEAWHDSITTNLKSIPLPSELKHPSKDELLVCYVDRQSTPRRMPDSEHDWLVHHLQSQPKLRFWHLLMQSYDGIVQLRVASECQVMIGVHGNGLSHLLWMKPKSHVLELYWDDKTRQGGYELLANTMQHNYMAIRKGWLVLDATHPNMEKQVRKVDGVDPLVNGRKLITTFIDKALGGVKKTQTLSLEPSKIYSKAHVDNFGDTHPRQCKGNVKHIHLSVGHDTQREMTISFASEWSDVGPPPIAGVRYGTRPDRLEFFVGEEVPAISYNTTYPKNSKAKIELYFSPYQHHITVRGLEPGTTYYYIPVIGTPDPKKSFESNLLRLASKSLKDHPTQHEEEYILEASGKWVLKSQRRRLAPKPYNGFKKSCIEPNRVRSFTTAPKKQSPKRNEPMVTFGIVGDLGQFTHSEKTLGRMMQEPMDLALLVGDIAYINNDHRRWDTFFDALDDYPLFHSTPLQIATGNHDVDKADDRPDIFQSYETRFRMPYIRPAELGTLNPSNSLNMNQAPYPLPYEWGNAYYSFTYGPSRHIVVSAYSSMEPNSTQYNWFVEQLSSVDRTVTPWVLVSIHVPLYNTYKTHHLDLQMLAAHTHLEPLLIQYFVNVVFTGHIHAYQRTTPVAFGQVKKTGPMHVTVGSSGRQCCLTPFLSKTPEPWLAARDGTHYGYGRLAIYNQTHAEWRWIPTSSLDEKEVLPPDDTYMLENQFFL